MSNENDDTPSNNAAPESSQMRWQFIDSSNNSRSNLTQVKRHVMQEYMRQKRHDAPDEAGEPGENERENQDSQQKFRRRSKKPRAPAKKAGEKSKKEKSHEQKPKPESSSSSSGQQSNVATPQKRVSDVEDVEEIERHHVPVAIDFACTEPNQSLPIRETYFPGHDFSFPPDLLDQYAPKYHGGNGSELANLNLWSSSPSSPFNLGLSPKSILSAARTDPFNTLPMELDLEGQRLFDFYVNEMPACSYGTHFRSKKAHNWYTAVFVPEGMKGPVAFQNTILVHAANTWAWVRNEEETDYTLVHRNRAISMLRDHMMKNPGDISDEAIIASLSAAGLEDFDPRPGRKQISWVHMRAAREMIRARGGPATFENTRLGMLINWQDYILSGYETSGPSFFYEHNPVPRVSSAPTSLQPLASNSFYSVPSPSYSISSLSSEGTPSISGAGIPSATLPSQYFSPQLEIQQQCDEFIDFLKRCERLAIYQQDNYDETMAPIRNAAFKEASPLYQILAAPPGLRFTASGNRKQLVARQVALIMLNAGLWDYRYALLHSETFLQTLELAILDSEVNTSGSVEALLQIMLECNDGVVDQIEAPYLPDFTQYSPTAQTPYRRPWFAGRMLKVAKRLSLDSWINVSDFLFSCLTLQSVPGWACVWESALREEIGSAPLTSYVMPSLE